MRPLQPVTVEWNDIFDEGSEWIHHDAKPTKPVKVRSTGFLLEKNLKFLVLVRDYYDHEFKRVFGGRVAIPVGCIDKIVYLTKKPSKT
jgi:hypothetical protein